MYNLFIIIGMYTHGVFVNVVIWTTWLQFTLSAVVWKLQAWKNRYRLAKHRYTNQSKHTLYFENYASNPFTKYIRFIMSSPSRSRGRVSTSRIDCIVLHCIRYFSKHTYVSYLDFDPFILYISTSSSSFCNRCRWEEKIKRDCALKKWKQNVKNVEFKCKE